jgi:hypothetical protein
VGSRLQARAGAAACLVFVLLALTAPGPAAAYRCEDARTRPRVALSTGACPVPPEERPANETKRGNMSGLTVFVLAVAAVLLIPIGARGIPAAIDPYRRDRHYWD